MQRTSVTAGHDRCRDSSARVLYRRAASRSNQVGTQETQCDARLNVNMRRQRPTHAKFEGLC